MQSWHPAATGRTKEISIAHSPDSDDAFMFYGLATNKIRVPGFKFHHTLTDIETLNHRAINEAFYDVTAIIVPRLSLSAGQLHADGLRRQRRRGLRANDRRPLIHIPLRNPQGASRRFPACSPPPTSP